MTRSDLPNPNRAHGDKRNKPMKTLLVAPLFEKKYKQIFIDLGLEDAANEELMAWYRGWQEARKDGEWESDDIGLQVSNAYEQLIELKHSSLMTLMNNAPPLKSKRPLNKITPQDVKQWMHAGRAYCITRGIYWKSFSRYMLTKNTLHEDILEGIRTRMNGKVFNTTAPWIISTYIEKIILEMMGPPERFDEMRTRLIDEHVRTIQKHENTVHLKSTLEEDAVQLTYVDPSYIGVKAEGNGYIPDEKRVDMKNTNFKQLLIDIIRELDYYVDMNEKYANRQPSSEIEREKSKNIINDLTVLIKTKKDRRISEEGSTVYKTQPKSLSYQKSQPTSSSPEMNLINKEIQELKTLLTKKGSGPTAQEKPRGKGVSPNNLEEVPESPHKFPCHKCENRPGTEREKKDHCTNKHHCRVHDGAYMCMKSQKCRDRTAKVRTLLEYKRQLMPPKVNKLTLNEFMHINEEEVEKMTDGDMDQPCVYGAKCPQQPYGNHTTVCKVEMKGLNYRKPGQTWREAALEQEDFNTNPEAYGGHPDQFANNYNFSHDSDEEEAEQKEDDHK